MDVDPVDAVFESMHQGDMDAAELVYAEYAPYLRRLIRRQLPLRLRAKFDSMDVVQSIWADLLTGFRNDAWQFSDARQLQAFLIRVARNRLTDRYRRYQKAIEKELPLAEANLADMLPAREPSASEVVQASDLWEQMLALCPPEHRQVLELKRQGLSLAEIVAHTQLHEGSVRRILRNLARKVAVQGQTGGPD